MKNKADIIDGRVLSHKLGEVLDPSRVGRNVELAPLTTFKIGGPADLFAEVVDADELETVVKFARAHKLPFFLLGVGANILVGDAGFRGLVIRNCATNVSVNTESRTLTAESGAIVFPSVIDVCLDNELSGFEHFAGIPSTIGGALWQNLHFLSPAPERERTIFIEEIVESAEIMTSSSERKSVDLDYFDFGYDYSSLHDNGDIVLTATFKLHHCARSQMSETISSNLDWRSERHPPLDTEPSAGSIFKKIEGIGAGRLIDAAGLKGTRVGGAQITHRHANILINTGGATASDVLNLIAHIRKTVKEHSGYDLQPEISMIGEFLPLTADFELLHD